MEEGYPCFPRNCTGEQGLTCSRRAHQKTALRNLCTDLGKLFRALQEVNNFLELIFGLLLACNILEGGLIAFSVIFLGKGFSKASHHLSATHGSCTSHHGDHKEYEDDPWKKLQKDVPEWSGFSNTCNLNSILKKLRNKVHV